MFTLPPVARISSSQEEDFLVSAALFDAAVVEEEDLVGMVDSRWATTLIVLLWMIESLWV